MSSSKVIFHFLPGQEISSGSTEKKSSAMALVPTPAAPAASPSPKLCRIHLYNGVRGEDEKVFIWEIEADEKKYKGIEIPTIDRKSTQEAINLREIQVWWSTEIAQKMKGQKTIDMRQFLYERIITLRFLKEVSYAYKLHKYFIANVADICCEYIKERQARETPASTTSVEIKDAKPSTKKIFELMRECGFYNMHTDEKAECQRLSEFMLQKKQKLELSYAIESTFPTALGVYLNQKLDIPSTGSTASPDDLLRANYPSVPDLLFHVRHCEDPFCTLHPHASPFMRKVNEFVIKKIVEFILKNHEDKSKTIFYGGFASGYLLRDLQIIMELIKLGYRIKFLFIDEIYADFIRQFTENHDVSFVRKIIQIKQLYKMFQEFANCVTANMDGSKNPVEIHVFSDLVSLNDFIKSSSQKLTVLVGHDYFVPNGSRDRFEETYSAHMSFRKVVTSCLDPLGCFFEVSKNDKKGENGIIYLHMGTVSHSRKYFPCDTYVFDPAKKVTKVFLNTSIGFFERSVRDAAVGCWKGTQFVTYKEDGSFAEGSVVDDREKWQKQNIFR